MEVLDWLADWPTMIDVDGAEAGADVAGEEDGVEYEEGDE